MKDKKIIVMGIPEIDVDMETYLNLIENGVETENLNIVDFTSTGGDNEE